MVGATDKVVQLAGTVKERQLKVEGLAERVFRLKATLELVMRTQRHEEATALTGSKLRNIEYEEQWHRQL